MAIQCCRSVRVRDEGYKYPPWAWHTAGAQVTGIFLQSLCHLSPRTAVVAAGSDWGLSGLPPTAPPLSLLLQHGRQRKGRGSGE
jgi:hypothetical protein